MPLVGTLQQEARALGDVTRHAIFRYVAGSSEPVDVAELTDLFRLNQNAIRQHLAKLLDVGLIRERTARPGRPGRPRLLFEIAPGVESRWGVTGPYERLSQLLCEVIRSGRRPVEVGREAGRALTAAPEPGAKPQSGLRVIRSRSTNSSALRTRLAMVSGESTCPGVTSTQPSPISKSWRKSRKTVMSPASGAVNSMVR